MHNRREAHKDFLSKVLRGKNRPLQESLFVAARDTGEFIHRGGWVVQKKGYNMQRGSRTQVGIFLSLFTVVSALSGLAATSVQAQQGDVFSSQGEQEVSCDEAEADEDRRHGAELEEIKEEEITASKDNANRIHLECDQKEGYDQRGECQEAAMKEFNKKLREIQAKHDGVVAEHDKRVLKIEYRCANRGKKPFRPYSDRQRYFDPVSEAAKKLPPELKAYVPDMKVVKLIRQNEVRQLPDGRRVQLFKVYYQDANGNLWYDYRYYYTTRTTGPGAKRAPTPRRRRG